jgi:hypothetical protein
MASAEDPLGGWKVSSLLVQVLTHVLSGPSIPQVAAMVSIGAKYLYNCSKQIHLNASKCFYEAKKNLVFSSL